MTSRPRHTASPHPLDAPEVMFGLFGSGLGLGSGFGVRVRVRVRVRAPRLQSKVHDLVA